MGRSADEERSVIEAWERGEPAELERSKSPTTSVLSMRLSNETLETLTDRARAEGVSPGGLARRMIIEALEREGARTPAGLTEMFSHWVKEYFSPGVMLEWDIKDRPQGWLRGSWVIAGSSLSGPLHHEVMSLYFKGRSAP